MGSEHRARLVSRRATLLGLAAAATVGGTSLAFAQGGGDRRFVVVILRGALDGLAAVVPYGDPDLMALRGGLVPPRPGADGGMLDLGGFYGLHPSLAGLHAMYAAGELLPVHAVSNGTGVRSHFVAQDHLELGTIRDGGITSGWLNRTAGLLASAGVAAPRDGSESAISVGPSLPSVPARNVAQQMRQFLVRLSFLPNPSRIFGREHPFNRKAK